MRRDIKSIPGRVRLAAVGDLLLQRPPTAVAYPRFAQLIGGDIAETFGNCELVFGNLECTLAAEQELIPTEPRVITNADSVYAVKAAGFNVVTLANNHMFDGRDQGFTKLRCLLHEIDLPHFGAGLNSTEASAPAVLHVNGLRIAFLGAVDHRSGPYQFASDTAWGVAPLDAERLAQQIRQLRSRVDHVIVSIHWGEERFLLPSPQQLQQARALVDAGASMILGHHPHVVQGLEVYKDAPIIYSLGNFIADDVYFSNGDAIRWTKLERTGCILLVELSATGVQVTRQIPTFDDGHQVTVDHTNFGTGRIRRAGRAIAGGVSPGRYRREHLWVKTVQPTLRHLRPSQLIHLRPRHFRNALRMLSRAWSAR